MTDIVTYSIISFPGRELPKEYEALIFSKWLRSLRKGNDLFRSIDSHHYYKEYHAFIEKLLQKPGTHIKMAALTEDSDNILGFSSHREDVLDYLYVQPEQRGQHISTALIPKRITTFTHMTKMWLPIWNSKYKHWKFNPFA